MRGRQSMSDLDRLREDIDRVFTDAFGRTPLGERLQDILKEAINLSRYTDHRHLKEEAGDLLCSLLQLFTECEWDVIEQARATLAKVKSRRLQYQTLGRKLSVALFGGAFNPVTSGHLGVARLILDASRTFDEVWLMPCAEHMHGKDLAHADHRLEMCRLAARIDWRIKVFDYEIKHRLSGETYHLVKKLLEEDFARDQYEFSIIIGQDNANSFEGWVNSAELERMIRFVVVPRKGVESDPAGAWYLRPPHIYLAAHDRIMEISSTKVRGLLAQGDPQVEEYLDRGVLDYIQTHGLYRAPLPERP
jgi:nicotinate-nucleotide adenylyltransferase